MPRIIVEQSRSGGPITLQCPNRSASSSNSTWASSRAGLAAGTAAVYLRRRAPGPARVPHPPVPRARQGTGPAADPGFMTRTTAPPRSPSLASRTDLKVIQQMLGHSSIVTTADTYTNSRELHQTGEKPPVVMSGRYSSGLPGVLGMAA
jgi:hypothetical protein